MFDNDTGATQVDEPQAGSTPVAATPPGPSGDASAASAPSAPAVAEPSPAKDPEPSAVEKFIAKHREDAPPAQAPATSAEPAASAGDPPAPAAEPLEELDVATAPVEKLSELTNETAAKLPPGEARRRINKLLHRVKSAEPLANLGADVITTCESYGISPAAYTELMRTSLAAKAGDEAAKARLVELVGVQAQQAPAQKQWTVEDERWLADMVINGEITKEAADVVRKRGAPAPEAAPPAPAQPAAQPPRPAQPDPQAAAEDRGTRAIADSFRRHTVGLSAADKERVLSQVNVELAKYKGAHPDSWGAIAENLTSAVVRRLKQSVSAPAASTVRPVSAPTQPPAPKNAKEAFVGKWHTSR